MKPIRHLITAAVLSISALASAAPIFVGQWDLYSGPYWQDNPAPALLTGQQAAALLFGGSANDYLISTAGKNVADINYLAWYDQYGFRDSQTEFAQDYYYDSDDNGLYDNNLDVSAMVQDHQFTGIGPYPYVNYAFRVEKDSAVPEPLSVGLMGIGLLGLGLVRRPRAPLAASAKTQGQFPIT